MNNQFSSSKTSLNHEFKNELGKNGLKIYSCRACYSSLQYWVIILLSQLMFACIQEPPNPTQDLEREVDQSFNDLDFATIDQSFIEEDASHQTLFDQQVTDSEPADMEEDAELAQDMNLLDMRSEVDDWSALELNPPPITQERCDGIDNDFDSIVDEGLSNPCGGCEPFDENSGCSSWRVNLVQTQRMDDNEQPQLGVLNPQRLIALSAAVMKYERFDLEGASCVRYGAPQNWEAAWSMGGASLNAPEFDLSFVPSMNEPGRYRAIGVDESPFVIHEPQDELSFSWEGIMDNGRFDTPIPMISGDEFNLESPALVRLAQNDELEQVIDQVTQAGSPTDSRPLSLRWLAEPNGMEAGPALTFYLGGSQLLYRQGAMQGIKHYQLNARLFDDGRLDVDLPRELQVPNSSIWVYLQRSRQYQSLSSSNPVIASIGHRYEARRSGRNMQNRDLATIEITSPDPNGLEPILSSDGLRIAWRYNDAQNSVESFAVSLILYDSMWSENLTCVMSNPNQLELLIPRDYLEFWPEGPQSVRQVTLSSEQKRIELTYPDRGVWRLSESLILRLSDL